MNRVTFLILIFSSFLISCRSSSDKAGKFEFREIGQGVELLEGGKPVFFYQKAPKSLQGQYVCCNYLHPLFSLDGDTLTEESPADHPYHRGVFWAWHQIYVGDQSIADGWVMENISHEVTGLETRTDKISAELKADVLWRSPEWQNGYPFVREQTIITTRQKENKQRIIDFEIRLRALTGGVSIGGSDDEKGYGGFCIRIKLPSDIEFTSERGTIIPEITQIVAGSRMDFSGTFRHDGKKSGITIICDPETPNFPASWILRKESSMQNIVFPGRQRVGLSTEKDLVLKYRVLIHSGGLSSVEIEKN